MGDDKAGWLLNFFVDVFFFEFQQLPAWSHLLGPGRKGRSRVYDEGLVSQTKLARAGGEVGGGGWSTRSWWFVRQRQRGMLVGYLRYWPEVDPMARYIPRVDSGKS